MARIAEVAAMQFQFTADQALVIDAIARIAEPFRAPPINERPFVSGEAVAEELDRGGFFEVALDDELGPLMGAVLVDEIARLPVAAEIGVSALVRPLLCPQLSRPLAVVTDVSRPARFVPVAKTVLLVDERGVSSVEPGVGDVREAESLYAYPMGTLSPDALSRAAPLAIDRGEFLRLYRIAISAEIAGAIEGALRFTVDYVTQRQQFGKPIGTFQAVQHRLSEISVACEAARWLTFRAASSGKADDALIACGHAQDAARLASRDLHQFNGAIGLTLEHPLHLWTYRIRALLSELGAAGAQDLALADSLWGANP
jgi:alkylation response protein AidB-like acyl-CoA dehydrogenase